MRRISKARPGSKIINGLEVPETAKIFQSKSGRDFYIVGANFQTNTTTARYLDTGEFKDIETPVMQKYLDEQLKDVDAYWKSKKQSKSKNDIPSCFAGFYKQ